MSLAVLVAMPPFIARLFARKGFVVAGGWVLKDVDR